MLVLGAAGFIGSHLCDALLDRGDMVTGVDDLTSSDGSNLLHLEGREGFTFIKEDICEGLQLQDQFDAVLNFASPASPPRYSEIPLHTLRTGSLGTESALRLSLKNGARFIMASTSEIYGDPTVSPQRETYWGNVNPVGERSCYDEAKRYSEALCMAYHRQFGADVGVIRIFNTYGPRLDPHDGRVVSNFIRQSLLGEDLTIYGDGTQTRSFCYINDEIRGIVAMLDSKEVGPINLGNPTEFTIHELAELVLELTGSRSSIIFKDLPSDDPTRRCPDVSLALERLNWAPTVDLREGLTRTISWFKDHVY